MLQQVAALMALMETCTIIHFGQFFSLKIKFVVKLYKLKYKAPEIMFTIVPMLSIILEMKIRELYSLNCIGLRSVVAYLTTKSSLVKSYNDI